MDKKKILMAKLNYDYDRKADVLYISFGKPKEAICVEKEAGVLLRVDPLKDKVVGITVINVKKKFHTLSKQSVEEFTQRQLEKYA
jgi:uncharacterized protein YuzE